MPMRLSDRVTWIGAVDWELRHFHGQEYSTHHGSTYNAYLVQDQKTAVVETVWAPFAAQFVAGLLDLVPAAKIDCVVANHAEPDHSGALPLLMEALPEGTPVYCTANGVKSLRGMYHKDWNFVPVKTGDRLSLGSCELLFLEAPMLHWPDTMLCYMQAEGILFSNDAFGQHLATEEMYNDLADPCALQAECIKYYANILTPFSPMVTKKIQEFAGLGLPLSMICPSHGVIWRHEPMQIVERYLEWAAEYAEPQVTVVYDTMWNSTRRMAEAVAQGVAAAAPHLAVKVFNCARSDLNDIVTEIFRSRAVAVGSPTINRGILSAAAALLEMAEGLKFRGKKAAAFGSYGWSGESVKLISGRLEKAGFEIVDPGVRVAWAPDADGLEQCRALGSRLAQSLG